MLSQKTLLSLFSPFNSDNTKIIPELTNDWTYSIERGTTDSFVTLNSSSLGQNIIKISAHSFLENLIKDNISTNGNKIIGLFTIGSNKKLYSDEIFSQYISLTEELSSIELDKTTLIPGVTYKNQKENSLLYLGLRYIQKYSIKNDSLVLTKIKKVKMVFNYTSKSFEELKSSDKLISIDSSYPNLNTQELSSFIKEKLISQHSSYSNKNFYIFIREFIPSENDLIYKFKSTSINFLEYGYLNILDDIVSLSYGYNAFKKASINSLEKDPTLINSGTMIRNAYFGSNREHSEYFLYSSKAKAAFIYIDNNI